MNQSSLQQIIKENLHNTIKSFLNEDTNFSDGFNQGFNTFSDNLRQHFEKEKALLNQQQAFTQKILKALQEVNTTIMNLGYTYNLIDNDIDDNKFVVKYYIEGSESWDEDTYYQEERKLYKVLNNLPYDIDVMLEDYDDKACINLTFDGDIIFNSEF